MAEQDDVFIGRKLLEAGRITREQLVDCLFDLAGERRKGQLTAPLGMMLARRNLVSRSEVTRILAERVRPPAGEITPAQAVDLALGELLVATRAATPAQVNECLKLQEDPKLKSKRLGELLVLRGYATSAQVQRVLAYQGKSIYLCTKCGARFNVLGAQHGHRYTCQLCAGPLLPAGTAMPVSVTDSVDGAAPPEAGVKQPLAVAATELAELPPDAQAHIDRVVKVYLKQKIKVRRSVLSDSERFQVELSRYGLWSPFLEIVVRFGGVTWQQAEKLRTVDFAKIAKSEAWSRQEVPGYRFLGRIASGGFGEIFTAEPVFGGPRVAIKVMHADKAREVELVRDFRNEGVLMMKFSHANIVKGYDFYDDGQLKYLVMELVEADSLDRLVLESHGLPPLRALLITRQVAEALRYMQVEGYIHRDVKPQNVLVLGDGQAKVCDLGLSQEIKATAVGHAAETAGTVGFMSPEQLRGELDLKVGTDIYALGGTLYFMLTAYRPFAGETTKSLQLRAGESAVAAPDMSRVTAPEPVRRLVMRMMEPHREKRFRTYPELIEALQKVEAEVSAGVR